MVEAEDLGRHQNEREPRTLCRHRAIAPDITGRRGNRHILGDQTFGRSVDLLRGRGVGQSECSARTQGRPDEVATVEILFGEHPLDVLLEVETHLFPPYWGRRML